MSIQMDKGRLDISIEGPISEKNPFFDINPQRFESINLDLTKVTFINSIGVKNWINWIGRSSKESTITLNNCPFVIVNQANIVDGFLPRNATIASFFAPYICDKCSNETTIKLEQNTHFIYATVDAGSITRIPESITCQKCAGVMEPDFIKEKTFSFLKSKI